MYAFVKVTGGVGRAFEKHCEAIGATPRAVIEAMIQGFVAEKNMDLPPPRDHGTGNTQLASVHLMIRDTKAALRKLADDEIAKLDEQLEALEAKMLATLNAQGVKSMRTDDGNTFYKEDVLMVAASDWNAVYDFIYENKAFHMLERRVTKSAVEAHMKEHGEPPPGVSTHREFKVRVRKGRDT